MNLHKVKFVSFLLPVGTTTAGAGNLWWIAIIIAIILIIIILLLIFCCIKRNKGESYPGEDFITPSTPTPPIPVLAPYADCRGGTMFVNIVHYCLKQRLTNMAKNYR